jgi:hypothetical protein
VAVLPEAEKKACSTSNRLHCCATSLFVWSSDLVPADTAHEWLTNIRIIPIATAIEVRRASPTIGLPPILDLDVRPLTNLT